MSDSYFTSALPVLPPVASDSEVKCINTEVEAVVYDASISREAFIAKVEAEGLKVSVPKDNELQIDIDSEESFEVFTRNLEIFGRVLKIDGKAIVKVSPSRSGLPNRHIRIELPFNVSAVERIAWQAALGSDPVRELLSMTRHYYKDQKPTLFVEGPEWSE